MNREATGLAGVRHLAYDALGSTNAEALVLARAGERGPLWMSARSQSAGRGRRGSQWISPPGNLYASLLLSEPSPKPLAPQISFVAALALHDALCDAAPRLGPQFKVKWPNDLLLGSEKLAGILIEGESEPGFAVVVGFGVNCASHPDDTAYPGDRSQGRRGGAGGAAGRLGGGDGAPADAMGARRGFRRESAPTGSSARPASARTFACACRSANSPADFIGLDEAGRLQLEQPEGLTTVTAGEVFALGRS